MIGLCECGCGERTTKRYRFVRNHSRRKHPLGELPQGALLDHEDRDIILGRTVGRARGYVCISLDKKKMKLHRIVAERVAGRPLTRLEEIDHINGNKLDNRRANLRVVTRSVNMQNRTRSAVNNKSGYRGVYRHKNRWCAQAKLNGVRYYLGLYATAEEAADVARRWRVKHMPGALS